EVLVGDGHHIVDESARALPDFADFVLLVAVRLELVQSEDRRVLGAAAVIDRAALADQVGAVPVPAPGAPARRGNHFPVPAALDEHVEILGTVCLTHADLASVPGHDISPTS